jgi:hypothetical protein
MRHALMQLIQSQIEAISDTRYRPGGVDSKRPVVLLADQPWDAQGGGAVILHSLLGDAIGNGVVWATPSRTDRELERGFYGLAGGSAGRGRFSMFSDTLWYAGNLAAEVGALADRINASAIWVVMHGASVAIAAHLIRNCNLPIHATVHDDPVYATALRSRRTALLLPLIARQFRNVLRAARSVDVVCRQMADRYRTKYGVECSILHRGLADPVSAGPTYSVARDGLRVGILGNTYSARAQLAVLGSAVELAATRLRARPRLVVCGGGPTGLWLKQRFAGRIDVDVPGHVTEAEGIKLLQGCAALYLNYPFGWLGRVLRETSFPTKLSTYIYAARPILVHAPPGTSLADIPAGNGYFLAWPSMVPADGAAKLLELLSSPQASESFHLQADSIRTRYYDLAAHRATLEHLLRTLVSTPMHESLH